MNPTAPDYLRLHFVVILFGFTGILGKLISIPAVEMVFYRTLLAAAGMAVLFLWTRRRFILPKRDALILLLTGCIVGLHWLTFFVSGRIANVSVSLVGFATASFWTAFLEPLMNRTRIKAVEVILGLFVLTGLVVIFSSDFEYSVGLFIAILSGLTCAVFTIINARLVKRLDPSTITLYEMIGAMLTIALFFPLYRQTWAPGNQLHLMPQPLDWVWMLLLAWLCTVYAYTAAVRLFRTLSVFQFQLTLNLEPVYGIVLALIVFGDDERMNLHFYTGTFLILCTVFAYPLIRKWLQPT
ncbi:MAG: DMT family transporter [Cytophagales bacterium]|nr:DMT family transporter [Cytophagales bacterium]